MKNLEAFLGYMTLPSEHTSFHNTLAGTDDKISDENTEDDKQTVSQLTMLASMTHRLVTVQCTASNTAGSADHSLSTVVTCKQ